MNLMAPVSGPYLRKNKSIARTMAYVMLALLPATFYGFYLFGWPAIMLFSVTLISAIFFESICLWIAGRSVRTFALDGSGLLTAWLLALSLPPWAPWWVGVVGSGVAIIIGKQVFGGLGQNVFNPAMVARVALLISFPFEMTSYVQLTPIFSAHAPSFTEGLGIVFGYGLFDTATSATTLSSIKTGLGQGLAVAQVLEGQYTPSSWMIGSHSGSMGEGPSLLLMLGGIVLIFTRIIRWHVPVTMLLSLAIVASIFHFIDPARYPDASVHIFTGATMLGAFFIATDPVTSPMSPRGQIIFAIGLALLIFIIRTWSQYPEGLSFAVLLMNALTPIINRYFKPRIFGRTLKGEPLNIQQKP